ncbi:PREDICTED: protein artemis-like, partial [Priapulus caudatus]|uniref:Protein artemis n=1 Tax=Priapulus caudatus TaxID=37621 RepID=A0ABM1EX67_PRICU
MSSFQGRMREYPFLSIDRFDGENLKSSAFFLSHCHTDHMVGLGEQCFYEQIKFRKDVKLYASDVTKRLLASARKWKYIAKCIEVLPVGEPTTIRVTMNHTAKVEELTVTLLPAGHCPGSTMFLFEGSTGTALYTGDFRLHCGDVARIRHLHDGDRVKDIESLYVDTTFCIPEATHIATRDESTAAIFSLVERWITQSKRHLVWLNCKSQYGYESLFIDLHRRFGMKVHVCRWQLEKYSEVPEIQGALTTDRQSTQIHTCKVPPKFTCCRRDDGGATVRVMVVKPSMMWFAQHVSVAEVVRSSPARDRHRVCFSSHASYAEIRDMVRHLRPRNVHPNVVPCGSTLEQVKKRLEDFKKDLESSCHDTGDEDGGPDYGTLGTLQNHVRILPSDGETSNSLTFDETPPQVEQEVAPSEIQYEGFKMICTPTKCGGGRDDSQSSGEQQSQATYISDSDSEEEEAAE